MTGQESRDPGELSRLLEDLAQVPRPDVPEAYFSGLRPGTEVGRFIVEREIGRGGFGVVYAALDPELGRTVALKLLRPGSGLARHATEWLRREAEAVARLSHSNIVTLHDFGRAPAGAYLVFELLRGETLRARLTHGPLPTEEAARIALAVARALAHAHQANVLHRDLKPANVFLCSDGAVKVLDFGIAHLFGQGGPSTGGTPAYMAPEQWRGEVGDPRTDLFALGVLLQEMLTGTLAFGKDGLTPGADPEPPRAPIPRSRAPGALRRLAARLAERDPAARPSSAQQVVEQLETFQSERLARTRPWRLVAVVAVTLVVAAVAAVLWLPRREPPAGERVVAALADTENATGDPELDRLGDLVGVALGESRRIQVLTRERLVAAGRGSSPKEAARLDGPTVRLLASLAGAQVVLLPAVRRHGDGFDLTLRGEPSDGGRPIFTATATAARKEAIPAALDLLVGAARRELHERSEDLQRSPVRLAAMTTASLAAFREYVEGLDCVSRPSEAPGHDSTSTCGALFERALRHDPAFALAHYQLALLLGTSGAAPAELRAHLDGALRSLDRLPRRDAALVLAWKAHLEGRDEEALATYGKVLADHPDDRQTLYLAGDLLFHRGDRAGALPYFRAALELDPGAEWALEHLAEALAVTRRSRELRELVAQLRALPPTPARRGVLLRSLLWLGDPQDALAEARRAVEAGGGAAARADLARVLSAAGELVESERIVRQFLAADPGTFWAQFALVSLLEGQGRLEAARQQVRALPRLLEDLQPYELALLRASVAAAAGDAARLGEEASRLVRLKPDSAGESVALVALLGRADLARDLAGSLPPDSISARQVEALQSWRTGDPATAAAALSQQEERDPWPVGALAPAYLLAELGTDQGEPSEALAAAERFQRIWPRGIWRGFLFARSLLLAARAQERLGQPDQARATVERLLKLLARADPALPLLAEARALRARLPSGPAGTH